MSQVPFQIQKALYDRLGGMFGLSFQKKKDIAVAIDVAILVGAQMERQGYGGFIQLTDDMLDKMIKEKLASIGAIDNKPFGG